MRFSSGWTNTFDLSGYPSINGMSWFGNEGDISKLTDKVTLQPLGSVCSIEEAYLKYSPLAAVILRISSMFVNGKFEILNRTTGNYTRGAYKAWDNLFLQPNPNQSRSEFLTQLISYVLLNGYCYVRPRYTSGFTDAPASLEILLPWLVDVRKAPKGSGKKREVYYDENNDGNWVLQDESKLILFKDTASPLLDHDTLLPISRIVNLKYPISNGIGAIESRNTLIYKRGAIGVLSNTSNDVHGVLPLEDGEKEDIENKFNSRYGLTRGSQSSVIVTDAALKWQSMVQSVKELMLHEEHDRCIRDICDIYGISHRLLSTPQGATYDNKNEDKKEAYNDTVIPLSSSIMEQLNTGLKAVEKNIEIVQDYEHLYIFQQSEKDKGDGMLAVNNAMEIAWDNGLITRNMWLEELELDTVPKEEFNKYKFELTPEQLGMVQTNINNQNNPGNNTPNNNN